MATWKERIFEDGTSLDRCDGCGYEAYDSRGVLVADAVGLDTALAAIGKTREDYESGEQSKDPKHYQLWFESPYMRPSN